MRFAPLPLPGIPIRRFAQQGYSLCAGQGLAALASRRVGWAQDCVERATSMFRHCPEPAAISGQWRPEREPLCVAGLDRSGWSGRLPEVLLIGRLLVVKIQ
ncbi:MAG TPA: hypothetical protein VGF67_01690 [Ktedonobacteraceae bacterium]